MFNLSNLVRSKGDPKIRSAGHSSLTSADKLARGLGWFSLALGALELFAPRRITRTLGMQGQEGLVRAYGVREICAGLMTLSPDKKAGLYSRVAGDGLDILTLLAEMRFSNPRYGNVMAALVMVGGITALDLIAAQDIAVQDDPKRGRRRLYTERSGFPKGLAAARGLALPQSRTTTSQPSPVRAS